jgi:hypothetical protein
MATEPGSQASGVCRVGTHKIRVVVSPERLQIPENSRFPLTFAVAVTLPNLYR